MPRGHSNAPDPRKVNSGLKSLETFASTVPKMQDFQTFPSRIHSIVNMKRRMQKAPQISMPPHWSTQLGMVLQEIDVVEEIAREFLCSFGVVFSRPLEDLLKIR